MPKPHPACSTVPVNFIERYTNTVVLDDIQLPVDCLPIDGEYISISHMQLGAADEKDPDKIVEGNIVVKVDTVSHDYVFNPSTRGIEVSVDIYLELPIKDYDVMRWATSHSLEPELCANKVHFRKVKLDATEEDIN